MYFNLMFFIMTVESHQPGSQKLWMLVYSFNEYFLRALCVMHLLPFDLLQAFQFLSCFSLLPTELIRYIFFLSKYSKVTFYSWISIFKKIMVREHILWNSCSFKLFSSLWWYETWSVFKRMYNERILKRMCIFYLVHKSIHIY